MLSSGRISHAFLLTGPRGIGKTTVARILAKAINCEKYAKETFGEPCNECATCVSINSASFLDLIEIDAASNRGIDDIRDLREKIKLSPASARFKVYIIDEAHMLTTEAFNALLKTLEEPPKHAIFILCTTEPQKLPETIISRCQRFDFKRPSVSELAAHIEEIAKKEKVVLTDDVSQMLAKAADGAFRDAVGLLDKVITANPGKKEISKEMVIPLLGLTEGRKIEEFLEIVLTKKAKDAITWIHAYIEEGGSPTVLSRLILETLREVLLTHVGVYEEERYANLTKLSHRADIILLIDLFTKADRELKTAVISQLPFELAIVSYISDNEEETPEGFDGAVRIKRATNGEEKSSEMKQDVQTSDSQNGQNGHIQKKEISFEQAIQAWQEIIHKMMPLNGSVSGLLRTCKMVGYDGKILTIEAGYRFHKERLDAIKVRTLIEKVAAEVLNEDVQIECILGEKDRPLKEVKKVDNFDVVDPDDEVVRLTKEIFQAEVLD